MKDEYKKYGVMVYIDVDYEINNTGALCVCSQSKNLSAEFVEAAQKWLDNHAKELVMQFLSEKESDNRGDIAWQ